MRERRTNAFCGDINWYGQRQTHQIVGHKSLSGLTALYPKFAILEKKKGTPARSDILDRIHSLDISVVMWWFSLSIIAAAFAILLFFAGVILWFVGEGPQGWIAAAPSPAVFLISKLLFDRYSEATENLDKTRKDLEEDAQKERMKREERRKKQEYEQEIKRKKQEQGREEDRKISDYMRLVMLYFKLASQTDVEEEKEAYFHAVFGTLEYNKQRIEAYLKIIQLEDEDSKKAFFRESLLRRPVEGDVNTRIR